MKKTAFELKKATYEDIPYIERITREAFKLYSDNANITCNLPALNESYDDIKKDIETKIVLIALYNKEIIGSLRLEIRKDNSAYLSRFGVAEKYQNKGAGTFLMNAVDEVMSKLNVDKIYLHTASKLLFLVRFYYEKGFYIQSTSTKRGYVRALLCKDYSEQYVSALQNHKREYAISVV